MLAPLLLLFACAPLVLGYEEGKWYFAPAPIADGSNASAGISVSELKNITKNLGHMRLAVIRNPVNRWSVECPGCGYPAYNCSGVFEPLDYQARNRNCTYATNGSPFDMASETSGCLTPVISNGVHVSSAPVPKHRPCFGMTTRKEGNRTIGAWAWAKGPKSFPSNMTQMMCGFKIIVKDGKSIVHRHGGLIAPRTALGLSAEGHLMSLVIGGAQDMKWGATMFETAEAMQNVGAVMAINFDGGGSSATWYLPEGGIQGCPTCNDVPICCVRPITTISCVRDSV